MWLYYVYHHEILRHNKVNTSIKRERKSALKLICLFVLKNLYPDVC